MSKRNTPYQKQHGNSSYVTGSYLALEPERERKLCDIIDLLSEYGYTYVESETLYPSGVSVSAYAEKDGTRRFMGPRNIAIGANWLGSLLHDIAVWDGREPDVPQSYICNTDEYFHRKEREKTLAQEYKARKSQAQA